MEQPDVEVLLQLVKRGVQLLAQHHAEELVPNRLLEALDEAVGFGAA